MVQVDYKFGAPTALELRTYRIFIFEIETKMGQLNVFEKNHNLEKWPHLTTTN